MLNVHSCVCVFLRRQVGGLFLTIDALWKSQTHSHTHNVTMEVMAWGFFTFSMSELRALLTQTQLEEEGYFVFYEWFGSHSFALHALAYSKSSLQFQIADPTPSFQMIHTGKINPHSVSPGPSPNPSPSLQTHLQLPAATSPRPSPSSQPQPNTQPCVPAPASQSPT